MTKIPLKKTNFGIPLPIKYIPTILTIPTMQVNKNPIILLRRCARLWPASDIMYHMLSFRFRLLLDFLLHFFTPKKCFFCRKNITAFASSTNTKRWMFSCRPFVENESTWIFDTLEKSYCWSGQKCDFWMLRHWDRKI